MMLPTGLSPNESLRLVLVVAMAEGCFQSIVPEKASTKIDK